MRCKAGELAFITNVSSGDMEQNLGKIVRVLELVDLHYHGRLWRSLSMQGPLLSSTGYVMEGFCDDECLTPIRGEPDNADETTKEKELERA